MRPTVEYARYLKAYYDPTIEQTELVLFSDGRFEEQELDGGDTVGLGEWEMDVAGEEPALVLRTGDVTGRYPAALGSELPLRAAFGMDPKNGEEARFYLLDPFADRPVPTN